MRRGKKVNNIVIGIFIFTGLFLFLGFIYFAGKFSFLMGGGYHILIEYDFLDNLQPGAKLRVSGGPSIGYVNSVNFETGKIVVEASIQGKYKINRGANFNIYATSLVGQKYINVAGYIPNATDYYTNNEYVVGVTPMGFGRTIEVAGAGIKSLISSGNADTVNKFKDVFNNTADLIQGLSHMVNDNSRDIRTSIIKLNQSLQATGEMMARVNSTISNLETGTRKLNKTLYSINDQEIQDIISNVNITTIELRNLSSEMNRLTYDRNSALSLTRDRDFKIRLDNTVKNFEEFSKKIKDDPSSLFFKK